MERAEADRSAFFAAGGSGAGSRLTENAFTQLRYGVASFGAHCHAAMEWNAEAMDMSEPYAFRLNVLTAETTVRLGDDGFQVVEKDKPAQTYSYGQVTQVRLSYEPSRASSDIYFCRIYVKGRAGPAVTVSSTYYRGFLNFEPQFAPYRALVEGLHTKLATQGKGVVYRAGVSNFAYWGNAMFLVSMLVLAAVLLIPIIADVTLSGLNWVKIAIIAFLAPLAAAWFWANRPRDYNPKSIPAEVLPAKEGN